MRPVVVTSLLAAAAAGIGALGVQPDSRWYRGLDKPPWDPPTIAYPLVWTPVHGLIAWGTGRAAERAAPADRRRVLALTAADLAVNAGWCRAFFDRESTRGGLITIVALDALDLALVREVARHDRAAAAALAPYVAWTVFATALDADTWHRNRQRHPRGGARGG